MAVYGDNATKALSPSPSNIINPGLVGGRLRVSVDTYEASSLAAGSAIYMCPPLPAGAKVIGMVLSYDALGSGVTLKVGDASDDDRYLAAASAASAGTRDNILIDAIGYEITSSTGQIIITTGGAAAIGTVKLVVLWSQE